MMLTIVTLLVRSFLLLASVAILTVRLIPSLRIRFLDYGAREARPRQERNSQLVEQPWLGVQVLDHVASWKVPHSWFLHFYIISIASSLAGLYLYGGSQGSAVESVPGFCAVLMLVQGLRRLGECVWVTKASASQMWIGHYLAGLAFYVCTNTAIWIEHHGDGATAAPVVGFRTARTILCTAAFLFASYKQHTYHVYLGSLKKYTLPDTPAFQYIVAPHYTAECVIYVALAILDAPTAKRGVAGLVNWTLVCALLFVVGNLGVTADGTKAWMLQKFPDRKASISRRWRMIPVIW